MFFYDGLARGILPAEGNDMRARVYMVVATVVANSINHGSYGSRSRSQKLAVPFGGVRALLSAVIGGLVFRNSNWSL